MLSNLLIILILFEAVSFTFAALLHSGIQIFGYAEARVVSEALIQGFIALLLVLSAFGIWKQKGWGRIAALLTHVLAAAGALLGILVQLSGAENEINLFSLLRFTALFTVLILLFTPAARTTLQPPKKT